MAEHLHVVQCSTDFSVIFCSFCKFLDLFNKYGGTKEGKLKLKKPKQLQEVLNIVHDLLDLAKEDPTVSETLVECQQTCKLEQLKSVLEM